LKLCQDANPTYRPWSWEDRVLKTLLGKPVMFYAPFAWTADSARLGGSLHVQPVQSAAADIIPERS